MGSIKEANLNRIIELLDGDIQDRGHAPRDDELREWVVKTCYSWVSALLEQDVGLATYTCGLFSNGFVVGALYTHLFGLPDSLIDIANRDLSDTQKR